MIVAAALVRFACTQGPTHLGIMSHAVIPSTPLTAADVERLSLPDKQVELVRGRLIVREPPGTRHGAIAANLAYHLSAFVRPRSLGMVCAQDTGFHISQDPDTIRAPDVAFIRHERASAIPTSGYAKLAPDLAVEVLSPGDRPAEVLAKVADWLGAGTRLVWVVDPQHSEVRVYRADGTLLVLAAQDTLDGEDVLPGFNCSITDVLAVT
jgi:Uma2 family endonuclease